MSIRIAVLAGASCLRKGCRALMLCAFYVLFVVITGSLMSFAAIWAADKRAVAGNYSPAWDSACGRGRKLTKGCEPVRARSIVDASKYPWSAIGRVNFSGQRTRLHCTGSLVSERIVLTAAHCLYNPITKKWLRPKNVHFLAGYQRGSQKAHSNAVRYIISDFHNTKSKIHSYNPATDWALIELQKPIGAFAGYLGWYKLDEAGFEKVFQTGEKISLAGYPMIRQHVMSVDKNCKKAVFHFAGDLILHGCAGALGDSGGPILLLENGKAMIIAIHSGVIGERGKFFGTSTPIANFYEKIVEASGGKPDLQSIGGHPGVSGKLPAR